MGNAIYRGAKSGLEYFISISIPIEEIIERTISSYKRDFDNVRKGINFKDVSCRLVADVCKEIKGYVPKKILKRDSKKIGEYSVGVAWIAIISLAMKKGEEYMDTYQTMESLRKSDI